MDEGHHRAPTPVEGDPEESRGGEEGPESEEEGREAEDRGRGTSTGRRPGRSPRPRPRPRSGGPRARSARRPCDLRGLLQPEAASELVLFRGVQFRDLLVQMHHSCGPEHGDDSAEQVDEVFLLDLRCTVDVALPAPTGLPTTFDQSLLEQPGQDGRDRGVGDPSSPLGQRARTAAAGASPSSRSEVITSVSREPSMPRLPGDSRGRGSLIGATHRNV